MSPYLRTLVAAAALAAPAWPTARAQEPRPAGRVLVLDNERLLEGEVVRQDDQFCVRDPRGGELRLPAEKVLKVCASREQAFAFVATRANLRDPDERLRLARWCQLNGLYEQAVAQAAAAVRMRPGHAESRRLLDSVQRAVATRGAGPAPGPRPAPPAQAAAPVDVSLESLSAFATRVQPVLMNACVRCHSAGRGGRFNLVRSYDSGPVNRRATQQNLAAVLAQVNLKRPELSPLLIKAVSAHGSDLKAPLPGQDAPPYRLVVDWILRTRATNPHLCQEGTQTAEAPAPRLGTAPPAALVPVAYRPAAGAAPADPAPTPAAPQSEAVVVSSPAPFEPRASGPAPGPAAPPVPAPAAQPSSPAAPADEFDPALFNQQGPRH
jgi:hypothetical protein